MTEREFCEKIIETGGEYSCSNYDCPTCPVRCTGGEGCGGYDGSVANAKQWLADHPEKPAESEMASKYATRGDVSFSLTLRDGRLSIYRSHGDDSESVTFGGTAEDFNQFDEENPEEWFSVAAKMIAERNKK